MHIHIYIYTHTSGSFKILTEAFAITSFMLVASSITSTPLLTSKVPYAQKVTWYEQRHKVIYLIFFKKKEKERKGRERKFCYKVYYGSN